MASRALAVVLALASCAKPPAVDAGNALTGERWVADVLGPVQLDVTTEETLVARLGPPTKSLEHRSGTRWLQYPVEAAPLTRRFYVQNGVVSEVHLAPAPGSPPILPADARALLGTLEMRDVPLRWGASPNPAHLIGVCALPGRPGVGVMFLFAGDRLLDASFSRSAQWVFSGSASHTDHVCP